MAPSSISMQKSSNPSHNYKYTPDSGTFSDEGKTFEKDATAFITLKSLKDMDDFLLISNPRDCAPFDDVILCSKVHNRNVIYLFQMSHKLIPTELHDEEFTRKVFNKKKSKFSLDTLYEKYPVCIGKIKKYIPQSYIEECCFKIIFYTNRPMQTNSEIFDLETETLFSTINGKVFKLKRKYITKAHVDQRSFLQCIKIYSNQGDINNSSIQHLKSYFNTKDKIVDSITLDYFGFIHNWCGITIEREGLTKEFIYKLLMIATFKNYSVFLDDYKETEYNNYLDFSEKGEAEFLNFLWKSIKNRNLTIHINHIQYVLGKVLEDLKNLVIQQELLFYHQQIISINDLKMPSKQAQLQYYIGCFLGKLPFIIRDFNLKSPHEFLKYFKVVFIESKEEQGSLWKIDENALDKLKQQTITTNSGQHFNVGDIISDKTSLSDLISLILESYNKEKEKKKEIIVDRRIMRVMLSAKLFSVKDTHYMDKTDLFIINTNGLSKNQIFIFYNVDKNSILFVKNQNEIERYLQEHKNNFGKQFNKFYKYIAIDEDIKINSDIIFNIHFIKLYNFRNDNVEWIKTIGDIENIKRYAINPMCNIIQQDNNDIHLFFNADEGAECRRCVKLEDISGLFQNLFIIITGVPGIGKSTFLRQLSKSWLINDFILFVTLSDHYKYFDQYATRRSNAEEHLNYFCKHENVIVKQFFKNQLIKNEIAILLDGFDEVTPRFTEVVSKMIRELRQQNYKIILTTRSVLKNEVENRFQSFAYALAPFDKLEIERFIEGYFHKFSDTIPVDSSVYKKIIMENRESNLDFFNVPLNLWLTSEFLSKDLQEENLLTDSYKLNQLTLYQKFVDFKYEIYMEKIKNVNIDKSYIERYHKYFAIKTLFRTMDNYKLIEDILNIKLEEFSILLQKGGEKIGFLIDDVNEIFVHRTLAEYFAAKWLLEIFVPIHNLPLIESEREFAKSIFTLSRRKNSENLQYIEFDCNAVIKNSSPIKLFFDLMINQNELHKAAYEGKFQYIRDLFYRDITTTRILNKFNRTLLHTIILSKPLLNFDDESLKVDIELVEILKLLISNYENILTETDYSGISVKNYASEMASHKETLIIFLYKSSDLNILYCNRDFELGELFHPENLHNCDIGELLNILQIENELFSMFHAAQHGNFPVIQYFFNNGINIDIINLREKHLLCFAAEGGKIARDIIRLLSKDELEEIMKLTDVDGKSLMDHAIINGNLDLINVLNQNSKT